MSSNIGLDIEIDMRHIQILRQARQVSPTLEAPDLSPMTRPYVEEGDPSSCAGLRHSYPMSLIQSVHAHRAMRYIRASQHGSVLLPMRQCSQRSHLGLSSFGL